MSTFEDIGRNIDRELEHLREVAETKVGPATAKQLRRVSEALQRLADDLEARAAAKAASPQTPKSE